MQIRESDYSSNYWQCPPVPPAEYQAVITKLLDNLRSADMSCSVRLFGLLTLGGIGKHRLVSATLFGLLTPGGYL